MTQHQSEPKTDSNHNQPYQFLPGDRQNDSYVHRMIRVNHAGEFGAKHIYAGQIAILGTSDIGATLKHMAEQENEHYHYFDHEIIKRGIRPSLLSPLWHVAGFALGAGTALLGKEAAMACTVAVEETIDAHYQKQIETLGENEQELKEKIIAFREEELEHRDIGYEHDATKAPAYSLLYQVIKKSSEAAIWLSKRL